MKRNKDLMNEVARNSSILHPVTSEESRRLKLELLEMYQVISKFCESHGLQIWLGGGSCLGAVRHKGFIPWDDDLDLSMRRQDYDKLLRLIEDGKFPDGYEFTYPSKRKGIKSVTAFLKIYKRGTKNVELETMGHDLPQGIFVDIFPLEYAYANKLLVNTKDAICTVLSIIGLSSGYYAYRNPYLKSFMYSSSTLKYRYRMHLIIGWFCSLLGHQKIMYWIDRFNTRKRISAMVTIPTGRGHYKGELLPIDTFFPLSDGTFEGIKVKLPHKAAAYLSNLYGANYMQLPPAGERERHFVIDLKFSDNNL